MVTTVESVQSLFDKLSSTSSDMSHHMPKLAEVGKSMRVVEIGFRSGVSATAFLAGGCKSLMSIDIAECKVPAPLLATGRFAFVLGDSLSVDTQADIVMIDGDHSHHGVARDLAYWSKRGRMLILHDTNCRKWPGVRLAMSEFLAANGEWSKAYEVSDCYGLTILCKE